MNTTRIICAGFGGQGIMLLGKILAETGMRAGKNVTAIPSYGAEVRGGTAYSMIIISENEIPSPVICEVDIGIIMNKPSFDKFQTKVVKGGSIILNSSLVDAGAKRKDINILEIPATEIAASSGSIRVANIVMYGAFIKLMKIIKKEDALNLLEDIFGKKKELLEINKEAFLKGLGYKK